MKHRSLKQYCIAFAPAIAWAVVIFVFSSQSTLPSARATEYDYLLKKVAHMVVYAVLFLLLSRGFSKVATNYSLHKHWYAPALICLVYAISDEVHQYFVVNRHPAIQDIGYDMLGVLVAYFTQTERGFHSKE